MCRQAAALGRNSLTSAKVNEIEDAKPSEARPGNSQAILCGVKAETVGGMRKKELVTDVETIYEGEKAR